MANQETNAPADRGSVPEQLGHYQVLEKIGQGGMAMVYRGVQPSLNRSVAIKILPPQFASTPELVGRFDREAAIVAQINHSNIVQVIDRGRQDNLLYIVMELVEGDSLEEVIRAGKLSASAIIDYATQICDGLDYAHSMGVVHRDLKPSNILIDKRTGRAKIADFGIAQLETTGGVLATLTYDHSAIGTMNYMSPEQRLDSHRVTHLTDIFSFGVIFYEMITGKVPIGHFKLPSLVRSDIPLGFDTIVRKCLAESPADRYQSAGEIRDELGRLTGRHTKAHQRFSLHPLERLNKRQRYVAIAAASVGGLVLLALAVSPWLRRTPPPPPPLAPGTPGTPGAPVATQAAAAASSSDAAMMTDLIVDANLSRAQGLIMQGKPADGIRILRDLVKSHPAHRQAPEAQFALASALYDMRDKEKCKLEFDRLVRDYPTSFRVPAAIVGHCRAEWETTPRKRQLLGGYTFDAGIQERLAQQLTDLLEKQPAGPHAAEALELLAAIAEPPAWTNLALAADTLVRLAAAKPADSADALYRAAEIYDRKLGNAAKAADAYRRFAEGSPDDKRTPKAKSRLAQLEPAGAAGR